MKIGLFVVFDMKGGQEIQWGMEIDPHVENPSQRLGSTRRARVPRHVDPTPRPPSHLLPIFFFRKMSGPSTIWREWLHNYFILF